MAETGKPATLLDELFERYRAGQISRRELLRDAGIAAAMLAVAGRVAPGGVAAQDETPKPGGTFTYALDQTGDTLDPEVTTYAVTNKININVFDPLVWQAPDLSFVPGLAESWEVAPDGKAYTFHLRQDAKFHDGTPVNAEAVKFSWERIMNPETKSKTAIGQMGSFSQAVVVDEFTVRAEFADPNATFLDSVSQSYCSPISPTAVQKFGADFAHNLVGTGPYMLKEWVENDHVTLVKNPDYNWAPSIFGHQGPGYLDEIVFKMIPDGATRTGTLQSGETDGVDSVAPKDVGVFKDDSDYQVLNAAVPGIPNVLALNTEKAPTNELPVRQALNFGIDKQTIISSLFFDQYVPAYGPLNAATLGFDESLKTLYPYDPEKAKSLLEEAGWTVGSDGIREKAGQKLSVSYYTNTAQDLAAPLIQAQWKDIGIDTQINSMDYNALIPLVTKGEANIGSIGWIQADPDVVRYLLYSKNIDTGYGWTRFRRDELDGLIVAASGEVDIEKRKQLYAQIQQITMQNALIVPVYDLAAIYALRSYVKNFRVDTRGWYPWLYDVW
ncbi:MAG TPA: ABC transporter substrate-binding protein, partial [Thermomicrobiales bacterium]|nr:ABC transporter substrate-binding protein [Thermomicrobiales bacterium]